MQVALLGLHCNFDGNLACGLSDLFQAQAGINGAGDTGFEILVRPWREQIAIRRAILFGDAASRNGAVSGMPEGCAVHKLPELAYVALVVAFPEVVLHAIIEAGRAGKNLFEKMQREGDNVFSALVQRGVRSTQPAIR